MIDIMLIIIFLLFSAYSVDFMWQILWREKEFSIINSEKPECIKAQNAIKHEYQTKIKIQTWEKYVLLGIAVGTIIFLIIFYLGG